MEGPKDPNFSQKKELPLLAMQEVQDKLRQTFLYTLFLYKKAEKRPKCDKL